MKVCVLQPSYEGTSIDYGSYDPPRDLSPLLPGDEVDHVFLSKATTYRQLRELKRKGYDVFVNLCEGYLDWEIPSIDVIHSLERLNLPYTGPCERLYDPSKETMKLVAHSEGVVIPRFAAVSTAAGIEEACAGLRYPLFVKPAHAGDSLGIDAASKVSTAEDLRAKGESLLAEYDRVLVEEYVDGREFTVLVAADPEGGLPLAFTPIEFVFPPGAGFKTYDIKVTQHHPDRNVPVTEPWLAASLKEMARRVFKGFGGEAYARVDARQGADGKLYFLEINFACSVFYGEGFEGSADYILKHDPITRAGFLRHIIREGVARHRRKQPAYHPAVSRSSGYGIFAARDFAAGEVLFAGEGRAQRLVTRGHVERYWSDEDREVFRRYAYPVGPDVYVLWDVEPERWAPQNHSCDPNTRFEGLDLVAARAIRQGEELTVDYSTFCGEGMAEFGCECGANGCRGVVSGAGEIVDRVRDRLRSGG